MAGRRRLALLAGGLAGVVLVGDAALVARALDGARAEEIREHQLVAERIFDELERELTALVDREEARSFLEYRYFFIPERQVQQVAGLVRSPISELSNDGTVIGYFQIDPDGTLYNPARPRDNELQFARDNAAYDEPQGLSAIDQRLADLTAGVAWDSERPAGRKQQEPPQQQVAAQQVPEPAYDRTVQSLNRGARGRAQKEPTRYVTKGNSVANFTNDDYATELIQQQQQAPVWDDFPPAAAVPLTSADEAEVDVVVSPIRGAAIGSDALVLHRTVRVGTRTYRQGLALDLPGLAGHIEARVVEAELRDVARLDWSLSPLSPIEHDYVFTHQFAAPFDAVHAAVHLSEMPGAAGGQRRVVLGLSAVLAAVTLLGAAGLYRSVQAELEFSERRNNFVAAVSHELKTPLTAIRMYAEMLREGIVPSEEKRQEYYETITAESERLSRLINNVLELSRLEKGNRAMSLTVGAVGPILEQTAAVLRPHVTQRGMALRVAVAPGLPPVQVDADALSQVLVNLVDNAVKFAQSGEVLLSAEPAGDSVRVVVRDQGPGVPTRQIGQIFEPFYRGERELTRRTKGTGIGLALVSGLVAQMGGQVNARNHPDGGLEVALVLPVGLSVGR